jgi:hypothetical protein
MTTSKDRSMASYLWTWLYGLVCGLGISSTVIGLLRDEPSPGVLWPSLVPLLLAPLLIMRVLKKPTPEATR